jgi:hypothetical protein
MAVPLVEYLLQKGADKDIADMEANKTPLQYSLTPVTVNLLKYCLNMVEFEVSALLRQMKSDFRMPQFTYYS